MPDDLGKLPRPERRRKRGCLLLAGVAIALAIVLALSDGLWLVLLFSGYELLDGLFQPIMTVPSVKGRVIELQTGQPVPGVEMTRAVVAWAFPRGLEGSAQGELPRSRAATVTDATGGFSFPPVRLVRGFRFMTWRAYREGWMPGHGRIWKDETTGNQFKEVANNETYPWVVGDCQRQGANLFLTIRVSRPTMDGITYPNNVYRSVWVKATRTFEHRPAPPPEPWGVYFLHLRSLALDRELDKSEVGRQALQHVSVCGPIGEDGVRPLLEIAGWLPGPDCAQIVGAVLTYCEQNTTSDECGGSTSQNSSEYLQYKCRGSQDQTRSP